MSVIDETYMFAVLEYIECMSMTFNKSSSSDDTRV